MTLKWCRGCQDHVHRSLFGIDRSRHDGLNAVCRRCKNSDGRGRYIPRPRPHGGRRFVFARDGDKKQARRRVNYLVEAGLIPSAASLPCNDCGDVSGDSRHEYDHHKGYASQHHESVEAVCAGCHHRRESDRG